MASVVQQTGSAAAGAFRAHLNRQGNAKGTLVKYLQQVNDFVDWLAGASPGSTTRTEILTYLDEWHERFEEKHGKPPAPATTKLRIDALKAFYCFLDDRDQLKDQAGKPLRNPMDRVKAPKVKRKANDWLRDDEDNRLLALKMEPHERMIIFLLRWLGVRSGEAVGLRIADVDLAARKVYIRESKTQAGLREIPLSNELVFELGVWFQHLQKEGRYGPHLPVLSTKNGTPMAQQFVWRVVKRVAIRGGLRVEERGKTLHTPVAPRTLRKTFGSHLLNQGMPLKSVSVLLGHQNTTITEQVYAELLSTTIEAQFRKIVG